MQRARPALKFIPVKFQPWVARVIVTALPIIRRYRLRPWLPAGIGRIEVENAEVLAELYHQFQAGKVRFLMAFRHPEVDDPLSMIQLVCRTLPKVARDRGIPLKPPVHSHFLYDRGMTIWAGKWLGWMFSRAGGSPIHRGKKLDWQGMRAARELLTDGQFPLAIAPEGATNGHSEIVSPLEPGGAQLAFWCVEDLQKANRSEEVFIVPIGIRYSYPEPPWQTLDELFAQLEADLGLPVESRATVEESQRPARFYDRLLRLGESLLERMEAFYSKVYGYKLPQDAASGLHERLQTLLNTALQVSEDYFGLKPEGTLIERCRRVENAGWHRIYREDIPDLEALAPVDRGLANWTAAEADLRMRHMRLVESFVAVTQSYVQEEPTVERLAETALILFDTVERLKGTKTPRRPRLGWRTSKMIIAEPISVSARWTMYQKSRSAARDAIATLTQDLETALKAIT
ncbi:1-acyl-sn-glycerol-3-phosphate acyltransferase [Oscillatoria sp. FACHB-1406]|uniref:1-acyl-sn-glycerol-3-phosphate acyltransferase n=1 Tax=Oscillatoria sp. FACHB-1406 TaxID=2692846 RepID=UPI00168866BE|nr:1-acyl-sn-glycerol-3-phosphate acyltransferase [Oscillatoria sp. FACHB-1406]MBD2579736.1 1-acyl-sn-glycerol-3-phosphate acyltransferase [Oscillatoria sp. FACHB-1406]